MSRRQKIAAAALAAVLFVCWFGEYAIPSAVRARPFAAFDQPPSREYPLGTDELGRNRFLRLLEGARVSLTIAPAAALLSVAVGLLAGAAAGLMGGFWNRIFENGTDLLLSLPMIFALMLLRAALPLATPPLAVAGLTFAFLACMAWAAPARIVRNAVLDLKHSDHLLQARAVGCSRRAALFYHVLPGLRHIAVVQWWIAIPAFVIAEANLSLLGLGVPDTTPSLGNLLRELESFGRITEEPWCFAPVLLLVAIAISLWMLVGGKEQSC
jgi:peptide/nickel transport system permease protein